LSLSKPPASLAFSYGGFDASMLRQAQQPQAQQPQAQQPQAQPPKSPADETRSLSLSPASGFNTPAIGEILMVLSLALTGLSSTCWIFLHFLLKFVLDIVLA